VNRRLLLPLLVFLLGAAALAAAAFITFAPTRPNGQSAASGVGGPFTLTTADGKSLTDKDLRGAPFLVFFGFTHCPDICPTTLFELAQVEPLLGADLAKFQTVFISVDPARDTVAQVKSYVANDAFPKRIVGLTGSAAQVDAAAKAYRVYYQKVGEGDDYTVNHAAYSYLMTPKGRFACVLPLGVIR